MKCRYCNSEMIKTYESKPYWSEDPYILNCKCINCATTYEFDETRGNVELWTDKERNMEIVELS